MRCPWPVLRLARAMRTQNEAILIADDPQAEREAKALAQQQGWLIEDVAEGWHVKRP
jgi:tRNA 2-thiouridine synthesizing protein A